MVTLSKHSLLTCHYPSVTLSSITVSFPPQEAASLDAGSGLRVDSPAAEDEARRGVSSVLIQQVRNTVKTFEELLFSSKLDHSTEQHLHEQLATGRELADRPVSKFSTGQLAPGPAKTFSPPKDLGSHKPAPIHK